MDPVVVSEAATKDGLPRGSFAYSPTAEPSSWKLPYLTPDGAPDPAHLPGAAAALSTGGFRGQPADIPDAALPVVKAKLRSAYRRWGKTPEEMPESIREDGALLEQALDWSFREEVGHDPSDDDGWLMDLAVSDMLRFREAAGDDHFFGSWHGGGKGAGGRPEAGGGGHHRYTTPSAGRPKERTTPMGASVTAPSRSDVNIRRARRSFDESVPGDVVTATYARDGKERTVTGTVKTAAHGGKQPMVLDAAGKRETFLRSEVVSLNHDQWSLAGRARRSEAQKASEMVGVGPGQTMRRADAVKAGYKPGPAGSWVHESQREADIVEAFDERSVRRDGDGMFTFSTGGSGKAGAPKNEEAGDLPNRMAQRFGVPLDRMNDPDGRKALAELRDALKARDDNDGKWTDALRKRVIAARTFLATGHKPSAANIQKSMETGKSVGNVVLWSDSREASGEDHMYGAWSGGAKGAGGRPTASSAQATQARDSAKAAAATSRGYEKNMYQRYEKQWEQVRQNAARDEAAAVAKAPRYRPGYSGMGTAKPGSPAVKANTNTAGFLKGKQELAAAGGPNAADAKAWVNAPLGHAQVQGVMDAGKIGKVEVMGSAVDRANGKVFTFRGNVVDSRSAPGAATAYTVSRAAQSTNYGVHAKGATVRSTDILHVQHMSPGTVAEKQPRAAQMIEE